MKRNAMFVAAVAAAFFVSNAAPAQQPAAPAVESATAPLAGFDAFVEQTIREWDVPGVAISVVKDGQVVLARGYGTRDRDSGAPMTADTIFPIASVTKQFTSFGVGLLVDEGKLDLDAPVARYLAGFAMADPAGSEGLTLRDMLSHRSGLPRHDLVYESDRMTRDELLTRLAFLDSSKPLRTTFQYNNILFILSGLAVERAAGEKWEAFTTRRIFAPLKMRRTFFGYDRARQDPNHAVGRELVHGKMVRVPLLHNTEVQGPAGGIYSTASDLGNWMMLHLDGGKAGGKQIIQPSTLAQFHRLHVPMGQSVRDPQHVPLGYGLGWFTDLYRGRPFVHHGGNLSGVSTMAALLPSERIGVAVLVNQGNSALRDVLVRDIFDRFLGVRDKDWVGEALVRKRDRDAQDSVASENKSRDRVAGTQPSRRLDDFAGTYLHPGYGPLTVRVDGSRLVASYNGDTSPLSHWHYDVFASDTTEVENTLLDLKLQFVSDVTGAIARLESRMEPSLPPIVFARQPDAKLSDPAYLQKIAGVYEFRGSKAVIAATGDRLTFTQTGGQTATLVPTLNGEFVHELRQDARFRFVTDASGRAIAMIFTDAAGIYECKRIG